MKKSLLAFIFCFAIILPNIGRAQLSWSVQYDTVPVTTVNGSASVYDFIINHTTSGLTLSWHVVGTNFPSDWLSSAALGLCDNTTCYSNGPDGHGHSMQLWNDTTLTGNTFTTNAYGDTTTHGSFDAALNLAAATTLGTYWLTVGLYIPGTLGSGGQQTMTFIISKPVPTSVQPIANPDNNVVLYLNPAANELNIVYDASADIKNIAVYNIIGKVMAVYKVNGPSANLNLENMPSGIYFVRLVNANGQVVVTKKFTKQ